MQLKNISNDSTGTMGECLWRIIETPDNCTLIISGNGEMEDRESRYSLDTDSATWTSHRDDIENLLIDRGIRNIGKYAFADCCNLVFVIIPSSVTSIGDSAFAGCKSLTSVIIPPSVTSIGDYAFVGCNLTSVVIPLSITNISDNAFFCCKSLVSVVIPSSVTSIGNEVFSYCESLVSVVIPASVTSIGDSAFACCESLTSVVIPASVTHIGDNAFGECEKLENISVADNNPAYTSVDNMLFNKDMTRLVVCPGSKSGNYVIPTSVTCIGDYAFSGCYNLTSIVIPASVTSIGAAAFVNCYNLTSIVIPASVTSIGNNAFQDCKNLSSITCKKVKPPKIDHNVFGGIGCPCILRVPKRAIEAYRDAEGWCLFGKNIVALRS